MRSPVDLVVLLLVGSAESFFISRPALQPSSKLFASRSPSKVVDLDGPTPEEKVQEWETVNPDDIPELHYDESVHPIPHQPWRRGETLGCEDPINAPWRKKAEDIITLSAANKGATVHDVTWYLTSLVITVDENMDEVPNYQGGPEVEFYTPEPPQYFDPDDPEPEPINTSEEPEFLWERDLKAEEERRKHLLFPRQEGEDDTADVELEMEGKAETVHSDKETREDMAGLTAEQLGEYESAPKPKKSLLNYMMDPLKISTISKGILDGLKVVEDELQILARHEVILTLPGIPGVLETQREFDQNRGKAIVVYTLDPWESNRTLRGTLLERNSMDLLINKRGRMVTIPLCFVRCVALRDGGSEEEDDEDDEFDEEYDEEYEEDD